MVSLLGKCTIGRASTSTHLKNNNIARCIAATQEIVAVSVGYKVAVVFIASKMVKIIFTN